MVPARPACPADRATQGAYAPRLDACLKGLDSYMPEATTTRPDGGFFISLTLPEGSRKRGAHPGSTRGLNLSDGLAFFPKAAAIDSSACRFAR